MMPEPHVLWANCPDCDDDLAQWGYATAPPGDKPDVFDILAAVSPDGRDPEGEMFYTDERGREWLVEWV